MPPPTHTPKAPLTTHLLTRSHSPTTSARIHADKFAHKPLSLLPTPTDARTLRRTRRTTRPSTSKTKKRKPNSGPLSAATKRARRIYEIPRSETRYELYLGLHKLWAGYMREILGISSTPTTTNTSGPPNSGSSAGVGVVGGEGKAAAPTTTTRTTTPRAYITPASHGATIASADMHGARLCVVRSRCAGRVGFEGIVVREGKMAFMVVTRGDRVLTIPKEHTVFRFEVPLVDGDEADDEGAGVGGGEGGGLEVGQRPLPLVFELHGEQFKNRAPDRANKRFKMHIPPDL